ncbi:hypothetical protein K0M31_002334 [Melipona bicolor]|uniref:Uncharacterized protein n=1 Tax=Melipona bicolor TaxID=60889 RepID=A0AA40KYF8_9HYME|nr:hypothetical protein K0M31_002334 [Melipona bicolor]
MAPNDKTSDSSVRRKYVPCGVTPMAVQSRGTNIGTHNFYAYARTARSGEHQTKKANVHVLEGGRETAKKRKTTIDEDGRVHGTMPGPTEKEEGGKKLQIRNAVEKIHKTRQRGQERRQRMRDKRRSYKA